MSLLGGIAVPPSSSASIMSRTAVSAPFIQATSSGGSFGLSGLPPIVMIDEIGCLSLGSESSNLLLIHIPTTLTSQSLGQLFAQYGRLKINVLLTKKYDLCALIQFDELTSARNAYHIFQHMAIE